MRLYQVREEIPSSARRGMGHSIMMISRDDSPFLADLLGRHPDYAGWLSNELKTGHKRTRQELLDAARTAAASGLADLHRFQMRDIFGIGARDLRSEERRVGKEC